jgi:putative flippase GtrA
LKDSSQPLATSARDFWRSDVMKAARKYFLVGGVSAIIEWTFFAIFLYWLDQHYLVSGTFSFLIATAANYFLSVRFVFGTGRRSRNQRIFLLYLVSAIGIVFNLGVLAVGIDLLGMHEMAAKIVATGAVFGWNFAARYFFVFQK